MADASGSALLSAPFALQTQPLPQLAASGEADMTASMRGDPLDSAAALPAVANNLADAEARFQAAKSRLLSLIRTSVDKGATGAPDVSGAAVNGGIDNNAYSHDGGAGGGSGSSLHSPTHARNPNTEGLQRGKTSPLNMLLKQGWNATTKGHVDAEVKELMSALPLLQPVKPKSRQGAKRPGAGGVPGPSSPGRAPFNISPNKAAAKEAAISRDFDLRLGPAYTQEMEKMRRRMLAEESRRRDTAAAKLQKLAQVRAGGGPLPDPGQRAGNTASRGSSPTRGNVSASGLGDEGYASGALGASSSVGVGGREALTAPTSRAGTSVGGPRKKAGLPPRGATSARPTRPDRVGEEASLAPGGSGPGSLNASLVLPPVGGVEAGGSYVGLPQGYMPNGYASGVPTSYGGGGGSYPGMQGGGGVSPGVSGPAGMPMQYAGGGYSYGYAPGQGYSGLAQSGASPYPLTPSGQLAFPGFTSLGLPSGYASVPPTPSAGVGGGVPVPGASGAIAGGMGASAYYHSFLMQQQGSTAQAGSGGSGGAAASGGGGGGGGGSAGSFLTYQALLMHQQQMMLMQAQAGARAVSPTQPFAAQATQVPISPTGGRDKKLNFAVPEGASDVGSSHPAPHATGKGGKDGKAAPPSSDVAVSPYLQPVLPRSMLSSGGGPRSGGKRQSSASRTGARGAETGDRAAAWSGSPHTPGRGKHGTDAPPSYPTSPSGTSAPVDLFGAGRPASSLVGTTLPLYGTGAFVPASPPSAVQAYRAGASAPPSPASMAVVTPTRAAPAVPMFEPSVAAAPVESSATHTDEVVEEEEAQVLHAAEPDAAGSAGAPASEVVEEVDAAVEGGYVEVAETETEASSSAASSPRVSEAPPVPTARTEGGGASEADLFSLPSGPSFSVGEGEGSEAPASAGQRQEETLGVDHAQLEAQPEASAHAAAGVEAEAVQIDAEPAVVAEGASAGDE